MTKPDHLLTNVVTISGFGLALAALGLSAVRRRAEAEATARRLAALAARVAALEARGALENPAPTPTLRADPPALSGPILIAVPDLAAEFVGSSEPEEASADLSRRFEAVIALADAGAPADEIARATGQPIGQVELILGLKRRRRPTRGPLSS